MSEQEFSILLQRLMTRAGLTQTELSERSGISKPLINRYLAGEYKPKQQNIFKLAMALNVDPEELSGWSGHQTSKKDTVNNDYYIDPETAELAQQIHDDPDLRILMDASRKLKPEELKSVINMIKAMKGIE